MTTRYLSLALLFLLATTSCRPKVTVYVCIPAPLPATVPANDRAKTTAEQRNLQAISRAYYKPTVKYNHYFVQFDDAAGVEEVSIVHADGTYEPMYWVDEYYTGDSTYGSYYKGLLEDETPSAVRILVNHGRYCGEIKNVDGYFTGDIELTKLNTVVEILPPFDDDTTECAYTLYYPTQ